MTTCTWWTPSSIDESGGQLEQRPAVVAAGAELSEQEGHGHRRPRLRCSLEFAPAMNGPCAWAVNLIAIRREPFRWRSPQPVRI